MTKKNIPEAPFTDTASGVSRRGFLKLAGASGFAGAAGAAAALGGVAKADTTTPDGTPEQIHLTWGADPTNEVVVSWASLAAATHARVTYSSERGRRERVDAIQRTYTDGLTGVVVFTYHARLSGLHADTTYRYEVTADNDSHAGNLNRPGNRGGWLV
ncbi:phosphodiesterase/alkaline phosphatase D-like protein [Paraburkholderia bannensis]|uniref:Phosphodiesterase/alkaline phosphatase D-like protein n=1 Tax=Paraburkholderia bannensis TaxID=765414 RepID=A0A7W9U2W7_9BURK|nr:phosphodiesterase/alkaline phosphatase D-like protein [Paraburkholderia sp. WP4_3_2]MBB6105924.1 phosphodiesterase/alkaline phosphatase D-like protein [Paraburkholderia bannensis]